MVVNIRVNPYVEIFKKCTIYLPILSSFRAHHLGGEVDGYNIRGSSVLYHEKYISVVFDILWSFRNYQV